MARWPRVLARLLPVVVVTLGRRLALAPRAGVTTRPVLRTPTAARRTAASVFHGQTPRGRHEVRHVAESVQGWRRAAPKFSSDAALLQSFEVDRPADKFDKQAIVGEWQLEYAGEFPAHVRAVLSEHVNETVVEVAMIMSISDTGVMSTAATITLVGGSQRTVFLDSLMTQLGQSPRFEVREYDSDRASVKVAYTRDSFLFLRSADEDGDEDSLETMLDGSHGRVSRVEVWRKAEVPGVAGKFSEKSLRLDSPETSVATPRRLALQLSGAAFGLLGTSRGAKADVAAERRYGPLPAGPFGLPAASRATVRRELVPGRIWSFEQVQGVIYVHVPVRMTVVRLDSGGLFVYGPIAPTDECIRLLSEIEAMHGAVEHILLPTLALEHKSFAGAFAHARPRAQLWVAPAQFAFPLDLPLPLLGFPVNVKRLPPDSESDKVPWASQLPYRMLEPLREKVGAFQEVVLFDRPTRSLLVTDLVTSISKTPPDIVAVNDLRSLLWHSRDEASEAPFDTPEVRAKGWQKICLFASYFKSSPLSVPVELDGTLGNALQFFLSAFPKEVPQAARDLGWAGFLPWRWTPQWSSAFEALSYGGRPFVPAILQELILNREPEKALAFADRVAGDFDFTSIIPAHFDAPVRAGPREWLEAFRPLTAVGDDFPGALPAADLAFLRSFERNLMATGVLRPRAAPRPPMPRLPR